MLCTAYLSVHKVSRERQVVSNTTDTHLAADDPVHIAALAPCDADVDGDRACWHDQHLQWPDSQLPCPLALSPETRPAQGR